MSIVLQGSTSGSVTLQEPAVAGTTILTLPAVTGTVLTTTSPKAGNVIQVVSANLTSVASTTSTSFVDTGLTASITPTSASSKILVLVTASGLEKPSSSGESISLSLVRNSTDIFGQTNIMYSTTAMSFVVESSMVYLDSPPTTSSTTYKLQFRGRLGGTVKINQDNSYDYSSITLLEIAA
jgi:hypothetical protein